MTREVRLFKSPNLEEFMPIIKRSVFRDKPEAVLNAMHYLEKQLAAGYRLRSRPGEIQELAGYISAEDPTIKRLFSAQPFHLFFYPSVTVDGTLIITMLIEARPEELRRRKRNYSNANKFLFNPIISPDGMLQKDPSTHHADHTIANATEHTAHTKFYLKPVIRNSKMVGITMLMHPFQRSRLVYDPSQDPQFFKFKERTFRLVKQIDRLQRILITKSPEKHRAEIETLERIRLAVDQLRNDINQSGRGVDIYLNEIKALLPKIPARRKRSSERSSLFDIFTIKHAEASRQSSKKSNGKPIKRKTTPLRQLLLRFIRDTNHVLNMQAKRGKEAEYQSANNYSSRIRELVLLDASQLVTKSFEHALKIPVRRYLLTAEQLRSMRLKGGRGNVVANMARVPQFFERRGNLKISLPFQVQRVSEAGRSTGHTVTQRINVISVDTPKVKRRHFKSRKN